VQQITVRVPASTSNLGPGFDCLGVALSLYNEVTLKPGAPGAMSVMVRQSAGKFFAATGCKAFEFSCDVQGNVPIARGLGSSVTVRLGVLHALNEIAGANLSRQDLFALCAELEGHSDNAAPASFGGFTVAKSSASVSVASGKRGATFQRFEVSPRLRFVLLLPSFEIQTSKARKILPQKIPRRNAVRNVANAATIVAAFATQDYEKLRGCFVDYLHQPYRRKLVPFLDDAIRAAEDAGGLGAFLSGSGSAVCAVTLHNPRKIAAAMLRVSRQKDASVLITRADNQGARIQKSEIKNRKSKIR